MDGYAPIRLLIILAAAEDDDNNGELHLARLAPPYYLFKDMLADVVLASPLGGAPLMVGGPGQDPRHDEGTRRFVADRLARDDLADTLRLDQIVVDDFDAAFCIGFSGSIWEADNLGVASIIGTFLNEGKPVAIIPGQRLDMAPHGAGAGLLIVGDSQETPLLAAHALLEIVMERRRDHLTRS